MLSILIPTYNYNAYPLVLELYQQCSKTGIEFEILCEDDASNSSLNVANEKVNLLQNCYFLENKFNLGRGKNINLLAEKAKFEYLLLMDCDTLPTQKDFIQNYIIQINENAKVVFGGIAYQKEKPSNDQLLRWVYGKKREALSVIERNKNPNNTALTSNLLIDKNVFSIIKFDESITKYGYEDLVFLGNLQQEGILVTHINNPTFHLGLETSIAFLEKTKTALENLFLITKTTYLDNNQSKILKTYRLLKRLNLVELVIFIFNKTGKRIEQNLLSNQPSLVLFDMYKLGYFCKESMD